LTVVLSGMSIGAAHGAGPSHPSEPTRIDFVAVDADAGDRARAAQRRDGCRVGVQAVWAQTGMRTLERLPGEALPLPPVPDARLDDGLGGAVQFDCRIDENWRAGIAWRQGRASADVSVMDRAVSVEAKFSGAEAVVSRRLFRSPSGVSLDALFALGWYRSHDRESVAGAQFHAVDQAPGARLGFEASWRFSGALELFARAEQVWLDFGRGPDRPPDADRIPAGSRTRVDFSGPAISAGVRWWLR
ncbi:MAG: hypothetical protein RIS35_2850, partial [Pseudomonadota bacterium]